MTSWSLRTKAIITVALILIGVGVGSAASAFWRAGAGGTGAGTGTSGSTIALTLSPGTPTAGLYPGGAADVVLTASNPNQSSMRITSLALDTGSGTNGFSVDAAHAACATAVLGYSTQTNGGTGWNVPGKVGAVNGSLSITLTGAITMSTAAANACQGATITVYLAAG